MAMNTIILVTGTEQTRITLSEQLQEYVADEVTIRSYAIDEGMPNSLERGLLVVSSAIVQQELADLGLLDPESEVIVARRTVNYDDIDQIMTIPPGSRVLFVNDVPETTYEGVEVLQELGIDFIDLIPYYPGMDDGEIGIKPRYAITPGEKDKVPDYVAKVFNIGPRIMDFPTIAEILNRLDILNHQAVDFSSKYLEKIINMAKRLAHSSNEITNLNAHLGAVVEGLNDGLLVFDAQGRILVLNENLKQMLSLGQREITGKRLKDMIHHKGLLTYLMDRESEEDRIFDIDHLEVAAKKLVITGSESVIVTFKNIRETIETNERLKKDLVNKGHFAKYTMDDIIGSSQQIQQTKNIAQKLAATNLTILLEGESGTGKELFASAIHNASERSSGPYLAVNFSSLTDELIESELFGYEEGSFTGAKKGGKRGLFEQADGGTIFLDEIGDASPKVQARLLRVLQEKEVMRIGGHEIKTIDVRVIAATNKDLGRQVQEGCFREDLYYRLKMGTIKLPPLRVRKQDIAEIVMYLIKTEAPVPMRISSQVTRRFLEYQWYGNVRELRNTLDYMMAMADGLDLTLAHLPDSFFFQLKGLQAKNQSPADLPAEPLRQDERRTIFGMNVAETHLTEELQDMLIDLAALLKKRGRTSRRELVNHLKGTDRELTDAQARHRLRQLAEMGMVIQKQGRHGTIMTEQGWLMVSEVKHKIRS